MDRTKNLKFVRERNEPWDIVVIGGGATGAGCALDAASRGFSVLLLEQHDFGKGTSSRSTKLIHGGVRYLKQGNVSLVREALRERALLLKNAPHAVHIREFVIPCYSLWQKLLYGVGMAIYGLLAGRYRIGRSRIISREETLERLPTVEPDGLSGGVVYQDGQFDDARFLIDLLRTADSLGAVVLNYCKVGSLIKDEAGRINGVEFTDQESGERFAAAARSVINAAGVFSDSIRQMSNNAARQLLTYAQGIHIVLDRKFLPSDDALMIPKTSDGRVLFCIPWQDRVLIGTTDTPVKQASLEPKALVHEVDFVLETTGHYLTHKPTRADILSTFAGIRPLLRTDRKKKTSSLSRGHDLFVDGSGLITITGGKWTTYRRMAEDAVDMAIDMAGLERRECVTQTLKIDPPLLFEGSERLHPSFTYTAGDVVRAVRDEMARTAEDVLARRTRMAFLDKQAAAEAAPAIVEIIKSELSKDDRWAERQMVETTDLLTRSM